MSNEEDIATNIKNMEKRIETLNMILLDLTGMGVTVQMEITEFRQGELVAPQVRVAHLAQEAE